MTQHTPDLDYMLERRRLQKSARFWRIVAFMIVFAVLVGVGWFLKEPQSDIAGLNTEHIARIKIEGMILDTSKQEKFIEELAEDDHVKGVILHIQSPGGTTSGAEGLYLALEKLNAEKPVVAVVDHLCASGGYIAALAADRIYARSNALVGSIGVLVQWTEFKGLMDNLGVKLDTVKSAPLKAEPNGFTQASPEARKAMQELVDDSFVWFKGLVQSRRAITGIKLAEATTGRIFTGRQAKEMGLIDAIAGEKEAKDYIIEKASLSRKIRVKDRDFSENDRDLGFLSDFIKDAGRALGLSAHFFGISRTMELDGLVSVWNPSGT